MAGIEVFEAWLDEDDHAFQIEDGGGFFITSANWSPNLLEIGFSACLGYEDDWKGALWVIECRGPQENSFGSSWSSWPQIHDVHPRLNENLSGQSAVVSFNRPVREPYAALGELMQLHWQMLGDVPLQKYLRPDMLQKEFGIVANGPAIYVRRYADVLRRHGMDLHEMFRDLPPPKHHKLLEVCDAWVIAESFEFRLVATR